MRFLGFNINISRRAAPEEIPISQLSPAALAWLRGEDPDTQNSILTNAYQQVVWVYRAINALAEQVANVPFLFSAGDRGRENLITSGPLPAFYDHPHPHINRFQYWELRIIWLMLRGECMRIPIYQDLPPRTTHHATRKLRKVLILDPAQFHHIIQDHELVGWRYTGSPTGTPLESQIFLPEEVWFEKLPNPFSFWRGMPPLQAADLATKTDFASAAFMHGIIENNADTGLIVRTDQQLTDPQREQIKATITNRKRRAGAADRPILLWGVNEIVKPTLSSADLQFLENRKFTRSEICAAFGVPEEIVTTTDHNKYDVMSGARLNFIENRVAPLCRRLEAQEEATVKALDPRAVGWFDLEALPIMQEALRKRLLAAKVGFDMGIPFNHLNRVFDLGFPPLPWGDTGFLPSKYHPLSESSSSSSSIPSPNRTEAAPTYI
jgi:phage portal protein BeeE